METLIQQLLANSQIQQKDKERVKTAMNSHDSFDDIIYRNLLQTICAELRKVNLAIVGDDSLGRLAAEILEEDSKFKQAISESKQRERELYQNHGKWVKQNLVTHNNIVAFNL